VREKERKRERPGQDVRGVLEESCPGGPAGRGAGGSCKAASAFRSTARATRRTACTTHPEGTLRCTGQRVQMQELLARNTSSEDSS